MTKRTERVKFTKEQREEHLDKLRKWFPKGSTVYTVLRHVSASGMSRDIGVVAVLPDEGDRRPIIHPNYSVAGVLERSWVAGGLGDGVRCNGAGMDMGFDLAYNLAYTLYGDGYALRHEWI